MKRIQCKKEKRRVFAPLIPPSGRKFYHSTFPVNPWFTMNHGQQAGLSVRYRQSTEAAYLSFMSDAPATAIYMSAT